MKRLSKTSISMMTAGALVLTAVPAASALTNEQLEDFVTNPPAKIETEDGVFAWDADSGEYVPAARGDQSANSYMKTNAEPATDIDSLKANPNAAESVPNEGLRRVGDQGREGDIIVTDKGNGEKETTTVSAPAETPSDSKNIPVSLKKGDTIKDSKGEVQFTADEDGIFAVLHEGDVIEDSNGMNVTSLRNPNAAPADPAEPVPSDTPDENNGLSIGALAALGIIALPLALTIGGIVYKLVKDHAGNHVYVPADKAGQAVSADDKAASDKLIADNVDEINRQAAEAEKAGQPVEKIDGANGASVDAAARANQQAHNADNQKSGARGIAAQTGSNVLAGGLIALVVASIRGQPLMLLAAVS